MQERFKISVQRPCRGRCCGAEQGLQLRMKVKRRKRIALLRGKPRACQLFCVGKVMR